MRGDAVLFVAGSLLNDDGRSLPCFTSPFSALSAHWSQLRSTSQLDSFSVKPLRSASNLELNRCLPTPKLFGSTLQFGDRAVLMGRSPLMLNLIAALISSPRFSMGRSDLFERVYGRRLSTYTSERLRIAMQHNLVKLISRTRQLLETRLTSPELLGHVRWFHHDNVAGEWTLVEAVPDSRNADGHEAAKAHPEMTLLAVV